MHVTFSITNIGLTLNILGTIIAFFWGYPQPSHESGVGIGLEDDTPLSNGLTVAQHNQKIAKQKKRFLFLSRLGLSLMFFGFFLQLMQ